MSQNKGNRNFSHGGRRNNHESFDETKIRNIKSRIESGDYSVINNEVVAKLDKRITSNMLRNIYHIVLSYHKEKENKIKAKNIALARIIYLVMKNAEYKKKAEYKEFVKLIEAIFSINDADKIKDSFEAMVCYSKLHLK